MVGIRFIEPLKQVLLKEKPTISSSDIDKICAEFPCFHAAFVMKAILLQDDKPKFEEALPQIAIRVLDRALLYDQIHVSYSSANFIETAIEIPSINIQQTIEKKEEFANNSVLDTLVSPEKELEVLAGLAKELKKKKKTIKKVEATQSVIKKNISEVKNTDSLVENKMKPKNISFIDWLKNKKSIEQAKEIEKVSERIPLDMAASNEAALMMEVKKSALPLEDFIVNQIEKKQMKKEPSNSPSFFIVSETYAQILANQGKILEAIQVYKELSIKYPKKSSNFARQIENLKNSL